MWSVRENLGPAFSRPNKDPILSLETIWPRPSAALTSFFAFVSASNCAGASAAAHQDPASSSSNSSISSSTVGWNSDIGRSLAARQVARCLSVARAPESEKDLCSKAAAAADCFSSGDDDDEAFIAAARDRNNNTHLQATQHAASRASATSQAQLLSPLRSVTNPSNSALRDFGGEDVLDLPHTALVLPTSEIAVIDRDLARVHVFAPNGSFQHRTLLSEPGQLVGPLGGCVTAAGHLVVCDMVGASVLVVDPSTGHVKVRWLGSRSGVVPEVEMRARVAAFRASFAMPKDALEIPVFSASDAAQQQQHQHDSDILSASPSNTVLVVSDYGSNALKLLHCGTGHWKSVEFGSHDVKPGAMCYDAAVNLLLVADENKNRVYLLRASDIAQQAVSLGNPNSSQSGCGGTASASIVGYLDLHQMLGAQQRSGPTGIASTGDGSIILSNPTAASVLCFSDLSKDGATKQPPRWGAQRNGRNLFAFPSGVTTFPYGSVAVVCRNTGFCHFLTVADQ